MTTYPLRQRSSEPWTAAHGFTHNAAGFTLLELLVTITVAAIIFGIGVPGFSSFIQNMRATTHTNDLVMALNLARSEATRRAAPVTVCSSSDAATCNEDDDWSSGWIVVDAGGVVLRTWGARAGGAGVLMAQGGIDRVRFEPRGSLAAPNAALNVTLPNCVGDQRRIVSINRTGRVSTDRVACP